MKRVTYKLHLYNLAFVYTTERRQLKESFGDSPNILMPIQFGVVIRNTLFLNPYAQF